MTTFDTDASAATLGSAELIVLAGAFEGRPHELIGERRQLRLWNGHDTFTLVQERNGYEGWLDLHTQVALVDIDLLSTCESEPDPQLLWDDDTPGGGPHGIKVP